MLKKGILAGVLMVGMFFQPAQASPIAGINYVNDEQNEKFWSLLDLGLDIARLSWADSLGSTEQVSEDEIDTFATTNAEGWRWASVNEFYAIHNWFDSDPNADGWSTAQKAGSALFFLLNGTGAVYSEQSGYDFEGYTYWQFGTQSASGMEYVWMSDFAWQIPDVTCATYSLLCQSGYFTDENSPLWQAENILQMGELNVAPLLVRERALSTSNAASSIPLPASFGLMALGLAFIAGRKRSRL